MRKKLSLLLVLVAIVGSSCVAMKKGEMWEQADRNQEEFTKKDLIELLEKPVNTIQFILLLTDIDLRKVSTSFYEHYNSIGEDLRQKIKFILSESSEALKPFLEKREEPKELERLVTYSRG